VVHGRGDLPQHGARPQIAAELWERGRPAYLPKELDQFGLRFYNPSPCSPLRGWHGGANDCPCLILFGQSASRVKGLTWRQASRIQGKKHGRSWLPEQRGSSSPPEACCQ